MSGIINGVDHLVLVVPEIEAGEAVYAALLIPGASAVGVTGAVWALHATTLLIWFARPADTWIAVFSAAIAVLAALALFGVLPATRGAGIAANFWHFSTLATYGQIGVLWIATGGRRVRVD